MLHLRETSANYAISVDRPTSAELMIGRVKAGRMETTAAMRG